MSVFTLDHHNTPVLAFVDRSQQFFDRKVFFLDIHIGHANFVKVLYLIVGFFHVDKDSINSGQYKRWKHKSNATVFHTVKGGAVPTSTHQIEREMSDTNG